MTGADQAAETEFRHCVRRLLLRQGLTAVLGAVYREVAEFADFIEPEAAETAAEYREAAKRLFALQAILDTELEV